MNADDRTNLAARPLTAHRVARRGNTRVVGLIVALLVALATLTLMGWFIFGPRGDAAREAARQAALTNADAAPPDITALKGDSAGGRGKEIHIQLVDKQDPTRVASEVFLPSVEPLENRRYLVQRPEAWFYMKDGKSVHIRADRGNLRLPSRDALPESGLLEGGVLVRLFEPTIDGTRPQPGRDVPVIDARTETLQFDGTLGELTTPDILRVEGRGVSFAGSQMRAIFDEMQQHIELLTFQKVTQFTYNPRLANQNARPAPTTTRNPPTTPANSDAKSSAASPAPSTIAGGTPSTTPSTSVASTATPTTSAAQEPRSTLYHATANGNVVLTQGQRIARSASLDAFALVRDGRIVDSAATNTTPTRPTDTQATSPSSTAASSAPGIASTPTPARAPSTSTTPAVTSSTVPSSPAIGDEVVTLEFSGPLEIKALDARPEALSPSNLAIAFVGDAARRATVVDGVGNSTATGDRITYFADVREAALWSAADNGVELLSPASGSALARDVRISLATGNAAFNGPGSLRTSTDAKESQRGTIAWTDHAAFSFVVRDGTMTSILRDATLEGAARAQGSAGELRAQTVQALFQPITDSTDNRTRLASLSLTGDASAADTRGGSLKGQSILVQFLDSADDAVPTSATAVGAVTATRGTSRLECAELEATFFTATDQRGKVDRVVAKDNVHFTGADGVSARSDLLTAFASDQIADLEGSAVTLSQTRPESGETASVTGTKMRLEGATGKLIVFGSGFFRQDGPLDDTPNAPRGTKAIARWSSGMTYDDSTGELDASGDTQAQAFSSPTSYDELKSQSIKLLLTKGSAPAQSAGGGLSLITQPATNLPPAKPDAATRKQLIKATALGTATAPASVTTRRFALGTPRDQFATAKPEMLLFLQGATIIADNAAGTLDVPGEGKLLVVDRRPEAAGDKPPTADTLAGIAGGKSGSRGNSLFDWKGSLNVARATNELTMSRSVRLIHTPLDAAAEQTELECDTLKARMAEAATPASPGATPEPTLRQVDAEGSVFAKSGKREVVADAVTYDAVLRRMEAWSKGVNMVTATDPASAQPITAQALFWDLAADRVEVRKPGTIVTPR